MIQLSNWLKNQDRLWLIGYVATIMLPFGLIFSRGFTEVCVAIICLMFLTSSFINKKTDWFNEPITKIALIAWLWLLFISFFAQNVNISLQLAIPWIRYIILYLAITNWVLISRDKIDVFCKIIAGMFVLVVADTLWQYVFDVSLSGNIRPEGGRLTGPLDNVKVGIFMAKMLIPSLGGCLFLTIIGKNKIKITALFFLLILSISTILLTGERTAFASTFIAMFMGAFFLVVFEAKFRKALFIISIFIIFTSVLLVETQIWVKDRVNQLYETVKDYPASEYGQLAIGGLIIGKDNLLTGVGLNGFRLICPDLLSNKQVTTCNLHPHNLYIEWFAGSGIIGLILFIGIVSCIVYKAKKEFLIRKGTERILPLILLINLIVNFFPFMPTQSIFSNWPAILLWYSVSVSMAAINMLNKQSTGK